MNSLHLCVLNLCNYWPNWPNFPFPGDFPFLHRLISVCRQTGFCSANTPRETWIYPVKQEAVPVRLCKGNKSCSVRDLWGKTLCIGVRFHRFGKWPAVYRTSNVIFIACLWCRQITAIGPRNRKRGDDLFCKPETWFLDLALDKRMYKSFSRHHATVHNRTFATVLYKTAFFSFRLYFS